uniref:Neur_chan_LBD domain-containing protein n=1 Tax=Elaeophora elaphi TaxID=1147741 RepID=A0A0R3S647_9BILA
MKSKYFFVFFAWIIAEVNLSHKSLAQNTNQSELWINTTYQAEDVGIRCEKLPQCEAWKLWWKLQVGLLINYMLCGDLTPTTEIIDLLISRKVEVSLNNEVQLEKFGLPKYLFSKYKFKIVHINFKKVCGNYSRYVLIDSISAAKKRGIDLSEICSNYEDQKKTLSAENNDDIESYFSTSYFQERKCEADNYASYTLSYLDECYKCRELETNKPNVFFTIKKDNNFQRMKRSLLMPSEGIRIINPRAEITYQVSATFQQIASVIVVRNQKVADFYKLGEMASVFEFHKGLRIDLEKVCAPEQFDDDADDINKVKEILQNWNEMESDDKKAKKNGSNPTMFFKRGIQLGYILSVFDSDIMAKIVPLSASFLMPFLDKSHYDFRSPPIIPEGKITEVFFGMLIQSMSNFDQSTMDYDMDIWLRMAWHDRRLAHHFDRPILVNDEITLKKIWRPAPFFQNAKEAEYHRMTTLNFWMYIFPNGEIFFETQYVHFLL